MNCAWCGYRIGLFDGYGWTHVEGPTPRGRLCMAPDPHWDHIRTPNRAEPEYPQARLV